MRGAPTLVAKDKVVEAVVNANASRLSAISVASPTACLSTPKPAGLFCAASALPRVAHNEARKSDLRLAPWVRNTYSSSLTKPSSDWAKYIFAQSTEKFGRMSDEQRVSLERKRQVHQP